MRLVPQTGTHEFSRPAAPCRAQAGDRLDKPPPVVGGAGRRRQSEEGSDRISRPDHVVNVGGAEWERAMVEAFAAEVVPHVRGTN